jgi:hypothetical protein
VTKKYNFLSFFSLLLLQFISTQTARSWPIFCEIFPEQNPRKIWEFFFPFDGSQCCNLFCLRENWEKEKKSKCLMLYFLEGDMVSIGFQNYELIDCVELCL